MCKVAISCKRVVPGKVTVHVVILLCSAAGSCFVLVPCIMARLATVQNMHKSPVLLSTRLWAEQSKCRQRHRGGLQLCQLTQALRRRTCEMSTAWIARSVLQACISAQTAESGEWVELAVCACTQSLGAWVKFSILSFQLRAQHAGCAEFNGSQHLVKPCRVGVEIVYPVLSLFGDLTALCDSFTLKQSCSCSCST